MYITKKTSNQLVKSPLNYIGGKQKILNQIRPLFPTNIHVFVDLFAGGCNVGLNVNAERIIFNDNLSHLIKMYKVLQTNEISETISHIEEKIKKFGLSLTNEKGYKEMRDFYNTHKNPLDLFVLIAYSFNHQIRFNNSHEFNNPFGKDRSSFNANMKFNLERFIQRIKELSVEFSCKSFEEFDFGILQQNDFVYCDPPYLITTGTYNDGKRGFKGWGEKEELDLLNLLDKINAKNCKFALSNVLEHKGKSNDLLKKWLDKNPNYCVNYLDMNYANSNYQTLVRDKNASVEVLITNYEPPKAQYSQMQTLFEELIPPY